MINCEEVTYLIEKRELKKLTFKEKINLKLHSAMCKLCRNYENDSRVLGKIIKKLSSKSTKACLSKEEKDVMKDNISKS